MHEWMRRNNNKDVYWRGRCWRIVISEWISNQVNQPICSSADTINQSVSQWVDQSADWTQTITNDTCYISIAIIVISLDTGLRLYIHKVQLWASNTNTVITHHNRNNNDQWMVTPRPTYHQHIIKQESHKGIMRTLAVRAVILKRV